LCLREVVSESFRRLFDRLSKLQQRGFLLQPPSLYYPLYQNFFPQY